MRLEFDYGQRKKERKKEKVKIIDKKERKNKMRIWTIKKKERKKERKKEKVSANTILVSLLFF